MIIGLVRFDDLDEVVPVPLAYDHPARVGAEHMPVGKLPLGAPAQVHVQDQWRELVVVTRLRPDMADDLGCVVRAIHEAVHEHRARQRAFDSD